MWKKSFQIRFQSGDKDNTGKMGPHEIKKLMYEREQGKR